MRCQWPRRSLGWGMGASSHLEGCSVAPRADGIDPPARRCVRCVDQEGAKADADGQANQSRVSIWYRAPEPRMPLADRFRTHDVANQPPPLAPYDAYATDLPLREALAREGGDWAEEQIAAYGVIAGGEEMPLAVVANENRPKLRAFDQYGNRRDDVEFHPAYHRLMELGIAHGVTSFAWRNQSRAGAHVARA